MISRFAVIGALACVVLSACGGGSAGPAAAAPSAAASSGAGAKPKAGGGNAQTLAERQKEFLEGCSEPMAKSPGYCECAWVEYRKAFTEEEVVAGAQPSEEKFDAVKKQIFGACSSKITDETAKAGWDDWCVEDKAELKPFCDCAWTEFRKSLSAAELGHEDFAQNEKFTAARPPVAKACSAKMPETFAKETFITGCVEDPKLDKFCQCGWKALRSIASAAEIVFDTVDPQVVEKTLEKQCAKVRPK